MDKYATNDLWPGVIKVKPHTNKYVALYRDREVECNSYKAAENWILEMKRDEQDD